MGMTGDEGTVSRLYTVLNRHHVYGSVSHLSTNPKPYRLNMTINPLFRPRYDSSPMHISFGQILPVRLQETRNSWEIDCTAQSMKDSATPEIGRSYKKHAV